ncbi:isochorismatase family protein [Peristeroidobacter soli]|uniref:isochorismatase family protein n=1 Tax=Peristeroidobacter soli TaxID=2497877 RepID=UPI0013007FC6|nr:isochorismatase family protein [Peristeroidobacter soli]
MTNPWDGFIPEETLDLYRRAGFAKELQPGRKPALLVIDTQYATTGEHPMPIMDAIAYHPLNCGEFAWKAIPHIVRIIAAFREHGLPVIYPHMAGRPYSGNHARIPKVARNPRHYEFVKDLAPQEGDILLPKTSPSAFFGTPLIQYLHVLQVDTLFMVGNTTSGCIRASVADGASYDYKVIVPHEGCYDRAPICHAVNLFDIASKYAAVVSTTEAVSMLKSIVDAQQPAAAAS